MINKYYSILVVIFYASIVSSSPATPACTRDLHICPDGTAVGRDEHNKCQFYPCPSSTRKLSGNKPQACTRDLHICPDGTAVGRDEHNKCQFYPCA